MNVRGGVLYRPSLKMKNEFYFEAELKTLLFYERSASKHMKYFGKIQDQKDLVTKEYTDQKYTKPVEGIPATDLADDVQTSLGKADTALQKHQSLAAYRTSASQDAIDATKLNLASKGVAGGVAELDANGKVPVAQCPIEEDVAQAASDWLDEHITQETGYVIDDSLTVAGAAADSKAVGDLKTTLSEYKDSTEIYNDIMGVGSVEITARKFTVNKNEVSISNPGGSSSTSYRNCSILGTPTAYSGALSAADLSNAEFLPLNFDASLFDLYLTIKWEKTYSSSKNLLGVATKNDDTGTITTKSSITTDINTAPNIRRINLTQLVPAIKKNGNFALFIENRNASQSNSFTYWLTISEIKTSIETLYSDAMGMYISPLTAGRWFSVYKNTATTIRDGSNTSTTHRFCSLFGDFENIYSAWEDADLSEVTFYQADFDDNTALIITGLWEKVNLSHKNVVFVATKNPVTNTITKAAAFTDSTLLKTVDLFEVCPEIRTNKNFALFYSSYAAAYPNKLTYWITAEPKKLEYIYSDDVVKKVRAGRWSKTDPISATTILHFSDIHSNASELSRILAFNKAHSSLIDDAICTGDLRLASVQSDLTFWTGQDTSKILVALGNHDYCVSADNHSKADIATVIQTWIGSNSDNWGVTITEGNSYYYKDYTTGVRLIVIDCNLTNEEGGTEQKTWLETVLADAKANSKAVVIATHYVYLGASGTYTNIETSFTNVFAPATAESSYLWSPSIYTSIVQDFIDGGGIFVCWLSGHLHGDYMSNPTGKPEQLIVTITAATASRTNVHLTTGDLDRTIGTPTQDAFNIVTIDTANTCLKIVRIGADINAFMQRRDMICYNYSTHQFVSE